MPNAKGTALLRAVRFLRRRRERALELLKPELHHYLEERIRESKWYPEEDLQELIEAIAAMLPGSREQALVEMGAQSAREHLEGIYSHLGSARNATPSPAAMFALWASQHDTGRIEMRTVRPGETAVIIHDYAHTSEAMCGTFTGYLTEVMRFVGGRGARIVKRECKLRGDAQCSWHVTQPGGSAPGSEAAGG